MVLEQLDIHMQKKKKVYTPERRVILEGKIVGIMNMVISYIS